MTPFLGFAPEENEMRLSVLLQLQESGQCAKATDVIHQHNASTVAVTVSAGYDNSAH